MGTSAVVSFELPVASCSSVGGQQQVGAQVYRDAAQKGPSGQAGVVQQVGHHAAGSGFAVGTGHGHGAAAGGQQAQHLAALANVVAIVAQPGPLLVVLGNSRGEHHQRLRLMLAHLGRQALGRVVVVNQDALVGKRLGERGARLVVAPGLVAVGPEPARQRRHADAADAEKVHVGKLSDGVHQRAWLTRWRSMSSSSSSTMAVVAAGRARGWMLRRSSCCRAGSRSNSRATS